MSTIISPIPVAASILLNRNPTASGSSHSSPFKSVGFSYKHQPAGAFIVWSWLLNRHDHTLKHNKSPIKQKVILSKFDRNHLYMKTAWISKGLEATHIEDQCNVRRTIYTVWVWGLSLIIKFKVTWPSCAQVIVSIYIYGLISFNMRTTTGRYQISTSGNRLTNVNLK